jgi:hypothetical protein
MEGELLGEMVSTSVEKSLIPSLSSKLIPELKEQVASELVSRLQKQVQEGFRQSFIQIVPAFETALSRIFAQIDESFRVNVGDRITNSVSKFSEIEASVSRMMKETLATTQEISFKAEEIRHYSISGGGVGGVSGGFRSATPPTFNFREMLVTGRADEAFTTALGMNDVEIVVRVCKEADTLKANVDSLKLSQPVILCIMQQLAVAFTTHTGVKLTWLKNCALALNVSDPSIERYSSSILGAIQKQMKDQSDLFIPPNPHAAEYKTLALLVHSLSSGVMLGY